MSKGLNILLIIAGFLVVGGIVVASIAFFAAGSVTNLSTSNLNYTKVETALKAGDSKNVRLELETDDVSFEVSPDDDFHFTYYESDRDKYELTQNSNEISLIYRRSGDWTDYIGVFVTLEAHNVTVMVPADYAGSIEVTASTGSINISRQENLNELSVNVTTGNIFISDSNAKSLEAAATTGKIDISDTNVEGKTEFATSTGRINLNKLAVGEDLQATTTTGGMELNDVTMLSAEITSTTGGLSLDGLKADKIVIQSTTGGIRLRDIDAMKLKIKATTGSVTGNLVGNSADYTITSSTNTGGNNLPENWGSGERSLNINTSTGSIDIEFND